MSALVFQEPIDIMEGLSQETANRVAQKLGFKGKLAEMVGDSQSCSVVISPLSGTWLGTVLVKLVL